MNSGDIWPGSTTRICSFPAWCGSDVGTCPDSRRSTAISPTTGQKVRQTQFVEQEEFSYDLDVFFIDGGTGRCCSATR